MQSLLSTVAIKALFLLNVRLLLVRLLNQLDANPMRAMRLGKSVIRLFLAKLSMIIMYYSDVASILRMTSSANGTVVSYDVIC